MCILTSGSLFTGTEILSILFMFSIEGSCILVHLKNKRVDDEYIPNVCKVMQITTFTTMWQQIIILTHFMEQAIQTLYIFYFYNIYLSYLSFIYIQQLYIIQIYKIKPLYSLLYLYIFYLYSIYSISLFCIKHYPTSSLDFYSITIFYIYILYNMTIFYIKMLYIFPAVQLQVTPSYFQGS